MIQMVRGVQSRSDETRTRAVSEDSVTAGDHGVVGGAVTDCLPKGWSRFAEKTGRGKRLGSADPILKARAWMVEGV